MNAQKSRIRAVMIGVGAAFDFHSGTLKRAPLWMQGVGLEWLYRLAQDPKRLHADISSVTRYFCILLRSTYACHDESGQMVGREPIR